MLESLPWLAAFAVCAVILMRAGITLVGAADEIAERSGLGRLVVGSLLLAVATSLPEALTSMSASIADAPDLAVGGLVGSSAANMAILALLDLSYRGRVWPSVELGHARVAAVGIGLTGFTALAILTPPGISVGWVGLDTIAIAGGYAAAVAWFGRSPTGGRRVAEVLPAPVGLRRAMRTELRPAAIRFAAGAAVVTVVSPGLTLSARELAETSGLGETFVGAALVAVATSLPELIASFAAVRIGSYDLAVGNLFGSNAANVAILVFADAAYRPASILSVVDPSQVVAAVGAIVLMALALAAIVHGEETRVGRLEPDAIVLLLAYVGVLVAVAVTVP